MNAQTDFEVWDYISFKKVSYSFWSCIIITWQAVCHSKSKLM